MKRIHFHLLLFSAVVVVLTGCRTLNPSVMLQTGKDYKYADFSALQKTVYKIAPNDELSFSLYSNDGFKMIDISSIVPDQNLRGGNTRTSVNFKVEFDGTIKLPLLGRTKLEGLTVRDAENLLEEKYSAFYNKPYILMEVTNRRIIVFPGSRGDGAARVIKLDNENTTLLEAIAAAGGISSSGKAYKVKVIRGELKNPQVYLIDLSTIDGMKNADMVMQANDIIYIEPQLRVDRDIMGDVLPYLTFITTIIVFVEFIRRRTA